MKNLELSKQEKRELEKRGFLVKEHTNFYQLIRLCLPYVWLLSWILYFCGMNSESVFSFNSIDWGFFVLFAFMPVFLLIMSLDSYLFLWKIFYTENSILSYWNNFKNINELMVYFEWKDVLQTWLNKKPKVWIIESKWFDPVFKKFFIFLVSIQPFYWLLDNVFIWSIILFWAYLLIPLFLYFLRQLVEHFHPLYTFWNLWEKIQKLTPQIASQSELIQREFEKDMNFSVLHAGFEKLSSIFSQIISLVLKLEQVEKRANKWNLFDSTKYINSLRSDIITPLTSLRKFLESQKQELLTSQKELTRVRVWWSEETGNIDLASKRSESLLQELDENIEKLDEMIGKMS